MKISIVITEEGKQIMMTPEGEHEKKALKMIGKDDVLRVVTKTGQFWDNPEHIRFNVAGCKGGYFRPFPEEESMMFVIKDK